MEHTNPRWKKIPSWGWVILLAAGIIGLMALITGTFFVLTAMEGAASIVLLAAGLYGFGIIPLRRPGNPDALTRGVGIAIFAFFGATIDQPGNVVYNKAVEICCCAEGTSLNRVTDISNPMPGTTQVRQMFTCYDAAGNPVKNIKIFAVLGIRLLEYLILAYLLIGLRRLLWAIFGD
jgi:hypothetical protein